MLQTLAQLLVLGVCVVLAQASLPATTPHFQEIFRGRCYEYDVIRTGHFLPSVPTNCSHLYGLFEDAFAYQPSCGLNSSRYNGFLEAASQKLPPDKSMFWSGSYELVHRVSNMGRNFITLEDTLIGYLVDRLNWCGNVTTGIDHISCPAWDSCEGETSGSFWAASSKWFANSATGEVYVMLNGSNPDRKAYIKDSFFGTFELPNINASLVTTVNAIVMGDLGRSRRETCNTGSLIDLRQDVLSKGLEFKCQDNPRSVLHLLCSDDPSHEVCQCFNNSPRNQRLGTPLLYFLTVLFIIQTSCVY